MQIRVAAIGFLLLASCVTTPGPNVSRFYLCTENLRLVRGFEDPSGSISRIEIVLTSTGSRDFELFTKRNYGEVVRVYSGDVEILKTSVSSVIRGGRIQINPPVGRGSEILESLRPPPETPCGSAA